MRGSLEELACVVGSNMRGREMEEQRDDGGSKGEDGRTKGTTSKHPSESPS